MKELNMIEAILIDTVRGILEVISIENTLQAKYEAIGNGCRLIEVGAYFGHDNISTECPYKDVMYVDEEVYLRFDSREDQLSIGIFKIDTRPVFNPKANDIWNFSTFTGRALIVGTDSEGNTTSHNVTLDEIYKRLLGFRYEPKEN